MIIENLNPDIFSQAVQLLHAARERVYYSVNSIMVLTYFEIGKITVEEEQRGQSRATYGKKLLTELSKTLTKEFGKGFSVDHLENMRRLYMCYGKTETASRNSSESISETASRKTKQKEFKLSWSHYIKLIRIDDNEERLFYEIECVKNNWSVRELKRQYDSALYMRLRLSLDKQKVLELSKKGLEVEKPKDAIKDPYISEFLGLPEQTSSSENELEQDLIDKLEHFLLELGNGFTFVARQKRITFEDKHFFIDLVFYNRILNCFVVIDLKIGELKHQDLGQMQMYVNFYDREIKLPQENKTIGLILCQNKSEALVQYSLPENNEQIFASKYKTILPSKEELKRLIEIKE